jgi:Ca2+-binding RTX toxin-like protein
VIDGLGGDDTLSGGGGNDLVRGGEGNDVILLGTDDGDDRLSGGPGFDVLDASALGGVVQVNLLLGTTTGTAGNDVLLDVFEQVVGSAYDDVLSGWHGTDALKGGRGDDTIFGNGGDDYISGGPGNDLIALGPGNDTLDFRNGDGVDTITDFVAGPGTDDTITLTFYAGLGTNTLAGLQGQGRIVQNGANTEIALEDGDRIILQDVLATNLHPDDFLFA